MKKVVKYKKRYKKIIEYHKYIDGYEQIRYFSGNYLESFNQAKKLVNEYKRTKYNSNNSKNQKYNLLLKNCVQMSLYVMSRSSGKYQKRFKNIRNNTIPNIVFREIKSWR